uniref:Uncharacterized protein n=1 Tax=uncultured bacterium A1Q1_fos_2140 TaxID=1256565 RepID=L7VWE0_9BACT|nr:hypothetical protein [uncultured bacterium A1Q1_fos_2140]
MEGEGYEKFKESVLAVLKTFDYEGGIDDFELSYSRVVPDYLENPSGKIREEVVHETYDNGVYIKKIWLIPASSHEQNRLRLQETGEKIKTWWQQHPDKNSLPNPKLWPPRNKPEIKIEGLFSMALNNRDIARELFKGTVLQGILVFKGLSLADLRTSWLVSLAIQHIELFQTQEGRMTLFRNYDFPLGINGEEWQKILDLAAMHPLVCQDLLQNRHLTEHFKAISSEDMEKILHLQAGNSAHLHFLFADPILASKISPLHLLEFIVMHPKLELDKQIQTRFSEYSRIKAVQVFHTKNQWKHFLQKCTADKAFLRTAIICNLIPVLKLYESEYDRSIEAESPEFRIDNLLLDIVSELSSSNLALIDNPYLDNYSGKFLFELWERNDGFREHIKNQEILCKRYNIHKYIATLVSFTEKNIREQTQNTISKHNLPENIFDEYLESNCKPEILCKLWLLSPKTRKPIEKNDMLNTIFQAYKPLPDFAGESLFALVRYADIQMPELCLLLKRSEVLRLAFFNDSELLEAFFEWYKNTSFDTIISYILTEDTKAFISKRLGDFLDENKVKPLEKVFACFDIKRTDIDLFTEALLEKIIEKIALFDTALPLEIMTKALSINLDVLIKHPQAFRGYKTDVLYSLLRDFPRLFRVFLADAVLCKTLSGKNQALAFYGIAIRLTGDWRIAKISPSLLFELFLHAARAGHEKSMQELLDFESYIHAFHNRRLEQTLFRGKASNFYAQLPAEDHRQMIHQIMWMLLYNAGKFYNPLKALSLYGKHSHLNVDPGLLKKLLVCFCELNVSDIDAENPDLQFIKAAALEDEDFCRDALHCFSRTGSQELSLYFLNIAKDLARSDKNALFETVIKHLPNEALKPVIKKHYAAFMPELLMLGQRFFDAGTLEKALLCLAMAEKMGGFREAVLMSLDNTEAHYYFQTEFCSADHKRTCAFLHAILQDQETSGKKAEIFLKYLEMAALKGNLEAKLAMAFCYREGLGLNQDKKREFYYLEAAADQGSILANRLLGLALRDGDDIEENPEMAVTFLEKAAKKGDPEAQFAMASCYRKGFGVNPNDEKALKYLNLAANQGYTAARIRLARHYVYDYEKNYQKAIAIFSENKEQLSGKDLTAYCLAILFDWISTDRRNLLPEELLLLKTHVKKVLKTLSKMVNDSDKKPDEVLQKLVQAGCDKNFPIYLKDGGSDKFFACAQDKKVKKAFFEMKRVCERKSCQKTP